MSRGCGAFGPHQTARAKVKETLAPITGLCVEFFIHYTVCFRRKYYVEKQHIMVGVTFVGRAVSCQAPAQSGAWRTLLGIYLARYKYPRGCVTRRSPTTTPGSSRERRQPWTNRGLGWCWRRDRGRRPPRRASPSPHSRRRHSTRRASRRARTRPRRRE